MDDADDLLGPRGKAMADGGDRGLVAVPLQTYFIAGKNGKELLRDVPDGGDLVPGLHFLGTRASCWIE